MKKILTTALTLLIATTLISQNKNTMTHEQKISYIIGYNWGNMMAQDRDNFAFDVESVYQAMKAAFEGKPSLFTQEEANQMMQEWQRDLQAKQQNRASAETDRNKAAGRAFLEKNKQNKDVVETASGLQYKVVRMGTGAKPTAADRVTVHYEGTLLDGTIFDSSYQRGETISFPLGGVITGWTEGLQLMPVGSKFIFYIPSDLAYGDRGAGNLIQPGSTLIFTVELFGINE